MSLSEHLANDRALFVLALRDDDPERRAALSHAEQCEECRALLKEGRGMLRLLDDARDELRKEPVDPRLEARVRSVIVADEAAARATIVTHERVSTIPRERVSTDATVVLKVVRDIDGRVTLPMDPPTALPPPPAAPWTRIAVGVGAVLSLLMFWLAKRPAPAASLSGDLRCFFYEQAFAVVAFSAGMFITRRNPQGVNPWLASLMAMGGALAGQLVLMFRCEAHGAAVHLLVSHVAGVAVAAALGAFAGKLRAAPSR